jgi:type IV fimbrial biogenesis protein FimT
MKSHLHFSTTANASHASHASASRDYAAQAAAQIAVSRHSRHILRVTSSVDSPAATQRGFSLIELMVTIAIVAILISVALPSLTDTIARNRIASSANDFIAGLSYARTEAIRTNHHAGVCPSASGVACDGAWGDRWIVYTGEPSKPTVLKQGEFSEKDQFIAESPAAIAFDARGMLATAPNAFELQPVQCGAGKPMRRLFSVQRTGSVSMLQGACL